MHTVRSVLRPVGLVLSAAAGVALALWLFASVMIVKVDGVAMLPALSPGQRVVALKQADVLAGVTVGDLVVYEAPCYTTGGESLLRVRRVTGIRGSWLKLDSDAGSAGDTQVLVPRTAILGKVALSLPAS